MTIAIIGAIVGLGVGYGLFEAMNQIAKRVERDETRRVLRLAGVMDVVVFPVVGFFVAPMMFGGA